MATQQERQLLIGAALTRDEGFRRRLIEDPARTASELGVGLTTEEVAVLRSLNIGDLNRLASTFKGIINTDNYRWGE